MIVLFRISVQFESGTFNCPRGLQLPLEQLPVYFYLITVRIQLDCFDRSVYSQCVLCNKTWLKVRKAFVCFNSTL